MSALELDKFFSGAARPARPLSDYERRAQASLKRDGLARLARLNEALKKQEERVSNERS